MTLKVKVGDKIVRFLAPSTDNKWKAEMYIGVVETVDDNVITGKFLIDQQRFIKYHRKTGLNLDNINAGQSLPMVDALDFIIPLSNIEDTMGIAPKLIPGN